NKGTFTYTINATNIDGYSSTRSLTFVVADETEPVITSVVVGSSISYGSLIYFTATVTDNIAVSAVRVLLNGTYYTMIYLGSDTYDISVNSTRLHALGTFNYVVYANDSSGNNADTYAGTVDVVDTSAPTISAVTETADPLALGSVMTISATVVDDISTISSVYFDVEGTVYSMTASGSRYSATVTPTTIDTYDYTIHAFDSLGNEVIYDSSFAVTDQTKPIISNVDVPDKINQNDSITFSADVTDNIGVDTVTVTINGTTYSMANVGGDTYEYILNTVGMDIAQYAYTIRATDVHSNTATATGTVWVTYIVPLYVTIRADKTSGEEDLIVSLTAVVTGGVGVYDYYWNYGDGHEDANMFNMHTFTRDGTFNVTLTVEDNYGNEGSDTVVITVGEEKISSDPRNNIQLTGVSFADDIVGAGESLVGKINIENIGAQDLEDISVTLFMEELGIWAKTTGIDVDEGDTTEKTVILDIPYDVEPGYYDVRIVVSNDEMKRVIYRDIEIK
ncbi:MAG: PKD domain-containing protein, partial [Candidatus Woesearchaeota archaeon]